MSLTPSQLAVLIAMLETKRPHGSGGDHVFRATWIHTLPGVSEDVHGNLIVRIGEAPILWSSHTDTVHWNSGTQTVRVNPNAHTIRLSRKSKRTSSCLGADDTVGVFIMREMILAGVEGLYIFHYGEESGCIGSSALAHDTPETLSGIQFAIAFDRAGTADVITHQLGDRCCSDAFALSLGALLPGRYTPARGVFTDTAEYTELVPECTNLSVGYYHQHSRDEYVDYAHVGDLLSCLLVADFSSLVCERDPVKRVRVVTFGGVRADDDYSWLAGVRDFSPREDDPLVAWCHWCDAPVLDDDDPQYESSDRCICTPNDDYKGMSDDDARFLRYLRER